MEEQENIKIELRCEEVQEIMEALPSWILRWGITIIAVVLSGLLLGSYFFKYPDSLNAPIVVTSSAPPIELNARATGKIESLLVHDKQSVEIGERLAIIESSANFQDILKLNKIFQAWQLGNVSTTSFYKELKRNTFRLGDVQSAYSAFLDALQNRIIYDKTDYFNKKIALKKQQASKYIELDSNRKNEYMLHKKQSEISKKIYLRDSVLFAKKIKTGEEFDNARKSYLQSRQNQLNDIRAQKEVQIQKLQEKEVLLDLVLRFRETHDKSILELSKATILLDDAIKQWKRNYIVTSPIPGYVNMMGIWDKNQSVIAGDLIMVIMPKNPNHSIGKAKFPAAGAGKIQIGQRAIIRLNNYPDEEFGFVEGIVSCISDIPDKDGNYIIDIKFPWGLKTNYGKMLPQTKQILGNVQIIIKDKRLIENLVKPIEKIFKNRI